MNILVTGGAGFLGSHLVDALLDRGHFVKVIDNLQTGSKKNLALAEEKHKDRLDFCKIDISNQAKMDYVLDFFIKKDEKIDVIFNFACPASPKAYQENPIHTMLTCVVGTNYMLDLAKRHGAVFIHASTSEIYGDPEVHPQHENYRGCVNTTGPRSCYDEGKRAAETLCFDYARTQGVRVKVARIFNTYGPRMSKDDGRVVSNFIVQALRGEAITIYGSGQQTRSFCYVSDLIDGFLKLMETPDDFTGPINLGNPNEFTIVNLMQKICNIVDENQQIALFVELPQDDPKQRQPDISLAKRVLDWEPKVELNEGLMRTIDYFRDEL